MYLVYIMGAQNTQHPKYLMYVVSMVLHMITPYHQYHIHAKLLCDIMIGTHSASAVATMLSMVAVDN